MAAPVARGWAGGVGLDLAPGQGGARLAGLDQRTPWRVLFPRPAAGEPLIAVLSNIGGGVLGGDRADIAVTVRDEARAVVTTQAAEKIYRAAGMAPARIETRLEVGAGAWLDWAPQEAILFDGARLERTLTVDVAAGGQLLAGEMLIYGRTARGERFGRGLLLDRWRVHRDGRLVWADGQSLDGDIATALNAPAGYAGAVAAATLVLVADDAPRHLDVARELAGEVASDGSLRAAATLVNGVLLLRVLGQDAAAVRAQWMAARGALRHAAGGLPLSAPRLWLV